MLRLAVNNFFEKSLGVSLYLTHLFWQNTGYMISIRQKQNVETRNLETVAGLIAECPKGANRRGCLLAR